MVDFGRERCAFFLEVGDQIAKRGKVEDGARQHMRPGFPSLFENCDLQGRTFRPAPAGALLKLREAQCGGKPCRPAANDENVDVERFAASRRYWVHPVF